MSVLRTPWTRRAGTYGPTPYPLPCLWHNLLLLRQSQPQRHHVLADDGTRECGIRATRHHDRRRPTPPDLGRPIRSVEPEALTPSTQHRPVDLGPHRGLLPTRTHTPSRDQAPRSHGNGRHRMPELPRRPEPPHRPPPVTSGPHPCQPSDALRFRNQPTHLGGSAASHQDPTHWR